jgi:hypothetical protein
MDRNANVGNTAEALKSEIARSMMDTLAEGALKKSKKTEATKKALARRRVLRNEAKKIAFAHDSQLMGAGNRRISLNTGDLVRRTSLYNTIRVNTPAVLAECLDDDSSDDEKSSVGKLGWKTVQRAIRSGRDFTTLEFADQINEDLQHLQVSVPPPMKTEDGIKLPNLPKQNSKLMMQNHAADRLGMTAANSKFTQKTFKGRFQPVTPGTPGARLASAKIRIRLPNPLRGLMSPISHRKQPTHPSLMSPLTLEPLELRTRSATN